MYNQNYLINRLRAASVGFENAPFLDNIETGEIVSYGQFFSNVERLAAALVQIGVKPADRIAVQAPKTQTMLELYIATVMIGAVFLPLNPAYTVSEVQYFLGDATPSLLVCTTDNFEELNTIADQCEVANILTLNADENGTLTDLRDQQIAGFVPVARAHDDLAAILYTSGTTGRSKGAMLTHGALASNASTLKDYWQFKREDILIHALPIFHTHGLFVATNISLMAGSSCIFVASFNAEKINQLMPRATALMGVPTFYVRLLKSSDLANSANNMRLFISGSAPLLEETHQQWKKETGHTILERYGMTETNMNTSNPYSGIRKAGTVGFPLPGIEVIVSDAKTGKELPVGETGVLEVRGPNVFAGYWKMPEKTKEELRENGFFITGGFNVYPKEIELLIDDLDGIAESAVIGIPHDDFGEAVVAIVVPNEGDNNNEGSIINSISTNLARFKQPKRIMLVKELPRNTMGKVQKNVMREEYKNLFG